MGKEEHAILETATEEKKEQILNASAENKSLVLVLKIEIFLRNKVSLLRMKNHIQKIRRTL